MVIRAVIFDFGDVLMRNPDPVGRRQWERRLGLRQGDLDRLVFQSDVMQHAMVGRATIADVWGFVGSHLSLSATETEQLSTDFWRDSLVDQEIVEFLRGLRPRFRTAILSDAWLGCRQLFAETLGLGDVFDEMIISAEEGVAKPDPAIFEIALHRLQVRPSEAVFVDDLAGNVAAAHNMGMRAIRFTNTQEVLDTIKGMLQSDE